MNFWNNWKDAKWLPNTVAVCSGVLLYLALTHLNIIGVMFASIWSLAAPLVIGVIMAYVMDPVVRFFEKKGMPRSASVVCMLLVLLGMVFLLGILVFPQLVAGVIQFAENIGSYAAQLQKTLGKLELPNLTDTATLTGKLTDLVEKGVDFLTSGLLLATSSGIGSSLATFGISFILAIYYLISKDTLVTWTKQILRYLLHEESYRHFASFCKRCNEILLRYIFCSLVEAIIVALANALIMAFFGMPYISVISCIVGVTNLAPTFGPIVGCAIGMFVLLLVKPEFVLGFLLITLVLQTIDGYIIKPKLFGNTLGVSSLLILVFLVLGGRLFGIWGILVAIPAAAILQYLFTEILFQTSDPLAAGVPGVVVTPNNGRRSKETGSFEKMKDFLKHFRNFHKEEKEGTETAKENTDKEE